MRRTKHFWPTNKTSRKSMRIKAEIFSNRNYSVVLLLCANKVVVGLFAKKSHRLFDIHSRNARTDGAGQLVVDRSGKRS